MLWSNQTRNQGTSVKLVVWYHPWTGLAPQTFHAFLGEEKKGTAVAGLTRRVLLGKCAGRWRTAIFYRDGVEIERWRDGHKVS